MKLKLMVTVLVVAVCAGAVLGLKALKAERNPLRVKLPQKELRVKGSATAQIKVLEFTDFQCPACARAALAVEEIYKSYEGKVSFEHKHFPLRMHTNATRASVFAQCAADQGKFWPMHDVLFKSQTSWGPMVSPDAYLFQLSAALGLDSTKLQLCITSEEPLKKISFDQQEGLKLGVKATPTFVVNGKLVVGIENLKNELSSILKPQGAL